MKVSTIIKSVKAKILCGEKLVDSVEIKAACGADMMSDVLAFVKDQGMLLTGLINPQVVRTAEMMDMKCILFVRGKTPEASVIELAEERGIILLSTEESLFGACGILYGEGVRPGTRAG